MWSNLDPSRAEHSIVSKYLFKLGPSHRVVVGSSRQVLNSGLSAADGTELQPMNQLIDFFFLSTPLKSGVPSVSPHLWCQHTALTDISGRLWRTNVHSCSDTSVRSGTEKKQNMSVIDFNTICVFIHFMPFCECSNCNSSSSYVH